MIWSVSTSVWRDRSILGIERWSDARGVEVPEVSPRGTYTGLDRVGEALDTYAQLEPYLGTLSHLVRALPPRSDLSGRSTFGPGSLCPAGRPFGVRERPPQAACVDAQIDTCGAYHLLIRSSSGIGQLRPYRPLGGPGRTLSDGVDC